MLKYLFVSFRYVGPLSKEVVFQSAIENGLDSTEFINLVNMLCSELKTHLSLNESVTCPTGKLLYMGDYLILRDDIMAGNLSRLSFRNSVEGGGELQFERLGWTTYKVIVVCIMANKFQGSNTLVGGIPPP